MFFNVAATRILLAFALASFTAGCSYFLKERPLPNDAIVYKGLDGQRSCLAKSLEVVASFFDSGAEKDETDRIIDCAVTSLDTFLNKTHPSHSPDRYSIEQLQTFVQKYFRGGQPLDPEIMRLMFRLKASMLGGSASEISKPEIQKIRSLILSFKDVADELRPHAQIYALKSSLGFVPGENLARIENASYALTGAVAKINAILGDEPGRPNFTRSDLELALKMGEQTVGALRFMKLGGLVKNLIVRPPADSIQASDWPLVLTTGARVYSLYLRYHYFFRDGPLLNSDDPSHLEAMTREVFDLVESGIMRRESARVEHSEIEEFMDALHEQEFWPSQARLNSAKKLLWPLTARILRDPSIPAPERETKTKVRAQSALGLEEFRRLRSDVENFLAGHRLSYVLAADSSRSYRAAELKGGLKSLPLEAQVASVWGVHAARDSRLGMEEVVSRGRLLVRDDEERLYIARLDAKAGMKRQDLVFANAIRALVRVIVRGYAHDKARAQKISGITEAEAQEFYLDLRDLAIDLGLADSRVYTAGTRSFMEATLFTSAGNGDEFMSVREGVEFFQTGISGGNVAATLHRDLETANCGTGEVDYSGYLKFHAECTRAFINQNFEKYFANLPGMVRFMHDVRRNESELKEFVVTLEEASRAGGHGEHSYEISDLRALVPVLYYAESLFVQFDRDGGGVLDTQEVWAAFPRFRDFIRKLGQGHAESTNVQRTIFSFLLTFGRPPSMGLTGKMELGTWWIGRRFVSESANRIEVLKIISSIAVHGRMVKLAEIDAYFKAGSATLAGEIRSGNKATSEKLATLIGCPVEAAPRVRELMRTSAGAWMESLRPEDLRREFCGDPNFDCDEAQSADLRLTSKVFAGRVNAAIQADETLRRYCWPLF